MADRIFTSGAPPQVVTVPICSWCNRREATTLDNNHRYCDTCLNGLGRLVPEDQSELIARCKRKRQSIQNQKNSMFQQARENDPYPAAMISHLDGWIAALDFVTGEQE